MRIFFCVISCLTLILPFGRPDSGTAGGLAGSSKARVLVPTQLELVQLPAQGPSRSDPFGGSVVESALEGEDDCVERDLLTIPCLAGESTAQAERISILGTLPQLHLSFAVVASSPLRC